MARRGVVRHGGAMQGAVECFKPKDDILFVRQGQAWPGKARRGLVRRGSAWQGEVFLSASNQRLGRRAWR